MTARIQPMLTSLLKGSITARIPSFERNKTTHEGWRPIELEFVIIDCSFDIFLCLARAQYFRRVC